MSDTKYGHLTLEDLKDDWYASHNDIKVCEIALQEGVTEYKDADGQKMVSVQWRIDRNKDMIAIIEQELRDRNITMNWKVPTVTVMGF